MKLSELRKVVGQLYETRNVTVVSRDGKLVVRMPVTSRHVWLADSLFTRLKNLGFEGAGEVVDGPGLYVNRFAEFTVTNQELPTLVKVGPFWEKGKENDSDNKNL